MCDLATFNQHFKNPNHNSSLLNSVLTLYQRQRFCDVQITINGRKYLAHRVILAASSDYFYSKIDEHVGNERIIDIVINREDENAILRVINYFYSGEIDFEKGTVLDVMSAASYLQVNELTAACCKFMGSVIDAKNCLRFAEIGHLNGCEELRIKAENFISNNIKKISQTDELKKITVQQLENLLKMNMNVASEKDVFECVKNWVKYDLAARKGNLVSLLKILRLPSMGAEILSREVQPLCDDLSECTDLIFQAIQLQYTDKRQSPSEYWITPRNMTSTIILTGDQRGAKVNSVLIYDPQEDLWLQYLDTEIRRWSSCSALIGDELFVIGGVDGSSLVNTVESVNLKTGKKTTIAPLLQARYCAVSAVVNGAIYVFGGTDGPITLNSVEKWDPITRRWSNVRPMISGREGCGIGIINDEIYVVGGWNRQTAVNDYGVTTVEAFCPATGRWRVCPPLAEKRHWVSAAVVNDKLYVVGGRDKGDDLNLNYKSVEVYDPETKKWRFTPNMSAGRYGVASGTFASSLIAVGGAAKGSDLGTVERLDISENKWITMSSLPQHRENSTLYTVPIDWLKRNVTLN